MAFDPGPTIPPMGEPTGDMIFTREDLEKAYDERGLIIEAQRKIIEELRAPKLEFKPGCAGYNFPYSLKYPLIP